MSSRTWAGRCARPALGAPSARVGPGRVVVYRLRAPVGRSRNHRPVCATAASSERGQGRGGPVTDSGVRLEWRFGPEAATEPTPDRAIVGQASVLRAGV